MTSARPGLRLPTPKKDVPLVPVSARPCPRTRPDDLQLPDGTSLHELLDAVGRTAVERERRREAPTAEIDLVRRSRLGALRLPRAHGGGGVTLRELYSVVIALAAEDPNVAQSLRNHFAFVEGRLQAGGSAGDDRWLDPIARGELVGLAASENSTSPAGDQHAAFETTLRRSSGTYVLDGVKHYSTGNLYMDRILVFAHSATSGALVRVIVPADREGIRHVDDWDGIGQRLTGSGSTEFHGVVVHDDEILAEGGAIAGDIPYQSTFPQLWLTCTVAGILRRIVDDAAELVRTRHRTYYHAPSPLAVEDPILQQQVGELASRAFAAEHAVLAAADALEVATAAARTGAPSPEAAGAASLAAAKAKVVVDVMALSAGSELFDVGGGTAVREGAQLDRHWRNIRTLASHNPRSYKARLIGRHAIDGTPLPNGPFF